MKKNHNNETKNPEAMSIIINKCALAKNCN